MDKRLLQAILQAGICLQVYKALGCPASRKALAAALGHIAFLWPGLDRLWLRTALGRAASVVANTDTMALIRCDGLYYLVEGKSDFIQFHAVTSSLGHARAALDCRIVSREAISAGTGTGGVVDG